MRDLHGIITEVVDKNGAVMVSYKYDAWGNWINKDTASIGTTLSDALVIVNPFIYKGYYYDSETDWYYLKSRYCCPVLSRFINLDNMSEFWKITLAVGIVSALVVGSVVTGGLLGAAVGGGISTVS